MAGPKSLSSIDKLCKCTLSKRDDTTAMELKQLCFTIYCGGGKNQAMRDY